MAQVYITYEGGWPCGVFDTLQGAAAAMGVSYRMAKYYATDAYRETHERAYIVRINLESEKE